MAENVCRLCSGNADLVWIFDPEGAKDLTEMIETTCDVKISKTDSVSQMVCSTCCQVTIKMYQFRTKSIKNDKDLKARCAGYNISQLTNSAPVAPTPSTKPPPAVRPVPPRYKFAHPSIKEIVKKYPKIMLPNSCLKSHVGAYITLLTNEVDEWYKERKHTATQIAKFKKEALELTEISTTKAPTRKRRKVEEDIPRPTSPTNSAKRIRLSSDSSDKSAKRKLRDKSDSDASSVASVNSFKSVRRSNSIETAGDDKPVRSGIKTRKSDASAKSTVPKTDSVEKSDSTTVQSKADSDEKPLSVLSSLLNTNEVKKITKVEEITLTNKSDEITLKSLLGKPEVFDKSRPIEEDDGEIIEIDAAPSPKAAKTDDKQAVTETKENNSGSTKPSTYNSTSGIQPKLFTSRLFVKDSSAPKTSEAIKSAETSSDSDPIVVDVDSRSSSECSGRFNENDKTSFVEALELAPKTAESNMPDLSLVSLAHKSHTLYTCKVCDSQHASLKDVKYHMKRTHTKCPFCRKRFKTLALRDEHVKKTCSINESPVALKKAKLQLVRVDEDEEIRKKYPEAFEEDPYEVGDTEVASKSAETPVACDNATADAIIELEKFLNYAEVIPSSDQSPDGANTSGVPEVSNKTDDVICISDDESEKTTEEVAKKTPPRPPKQKIDVVNSEILAHINIHDNDVNVLKRILSLSKLKSALNARKNAWYLENTPILNGGSSRVKIFRNLRQYLQQYKIPIEVRHGAILDVGYKKTQPPPARKNRNLWHHLKPIELKPLDPPQPPPAPPKPATSSPPTYKILNAQIAANMNPSSAGNVKLVNIPVMQSGPSQTAQNQVVSTANFLLSGGAVVTTSTSGSGGPLLLNGTRTVNSTKYANIILVSNSLLTMPSTQGPLPVIASVSSAVDETAPSINKVAQLESITNSLMPTSKNCDVVVSVANVVMPMPTVTHATNVTTIVSDQPGQQPAIRVKNLKELS